MNKIAFMFPGQGSQSVGMGKELYETYPIVRALYEEADELLGMKLSELMFNGPEENLKATENAQPALLLSSIAVHSVLTEYGIKPDMAVGHSLGEYSALVASGALSFQDAIRLVQKRGQLMEQAYPKGQGAMAAVLGLEQAKVEAALEQISGDQPVDVANLNCPGQIVISGSKEGIGQAESVLKEAGAKRVKELAVSGPFHSRLMKPASEKFAAELEGITIQDPVIPMFANVTAAPVSTAAEVKDLLIKQLYSPVRFSEAASTMIEKGASRFVELGNGKVLCGLLKKIDKSIPTYAVQDKETLEGLAAWLKEETQNA
ncbi:ACP S-malonyltransferase [Aciduricibacillus chroicocephali]|uniref:Malonyl CoA-acyl carrier protein transacylase n=1 Tax=Aciduricibacillus chroicocephali TaxID=3054939 RepID=A0ABY9L1Q3_9BACI|nr:ACP S-malonyltransferase [Bacillaceae bacterium 44XB]